MTVIPTNKPSKQFLTADEFTAPKEGNQQQLEGYLYDTQTKKSRRVNINLLSV